MRKRVVGVVLFGLAGLIGIGALVQSLPVPQPEPLDDPVVAAVDPRNEPDRHARQAKEEEIRVRFNQAILMLHGGQYDYAVKALHRVLELAPTMPEAHVNMGFAFLGGGDPRTARDFFLSAIELNPQQLNAYYGWGVAAEALGDMEAALGAMRTYVHLSTPEDPYLARARAALWEWQADREPAPLMAGDE